MASTLTSLLIHVVFSTKDRQDLIRPDDEEHLYNYIAGIVSNHTCRLLTIGGTANHLHLLISFSKNLALAKLMEDLKKDSSKWIKTQGEYAGFHWQEGYGAFSIGQSNVPALRAYIAKQKQHHRRTTFQEEFLQILKRYDVAFDSRYIWR